MYIDGHCDSLQRCLDEKLALNSKKLDFNIVDSKKYFPCIQTCAAYVNDECVEGFKRANDILECYLKNIGNTILVKSKKDIENVLDGKSQGILLSIENGKAIDDNLNNIDLLYDKGVRMMGVTWNNDNLIGCGALSKNDIGLTDFGKRYIRKLEQKNIIIDISHCSKKTFWDVLESTDGMVVASHSCCENICKHPRNLDDKQIKEIAKRNGIIGICLCSSFLRNSGKATVEDIVKHISYIINLVGDDYVGIGSDFDGVDLNHKLLDVEGVKDICIIEDALNKEGFSTKTINKIMGENWLRVIINL